MFKRLHDHQYKGIDSLNHAADKTYGVKKCIVYTKLTTMRVYTFDKTGIMN